MSDARARWDAAGEYLWLLVSTSVLALATVGAARESSTWPLSVGGLLVVNAVLSGRRLVAKVRRVGCDAECR
ncbi:hypothetical protein DQ237_10210 [Blastococcus sp. TF02-8]|uniref:hypothetical protein n=1 Tax=Blastococcus sp. TF02-8 TaxID=2250574 RepID=UPI000DE85F28|nr:hypothetical protein [Blastococcus sp. TF02-8]RBY96227.1 hypothetical protein DQ237_10210 [Blastococcus sp. TF02-8]